MTVIGYIFGIPITIAALYFLLLRPVFRFLSNADPVSFLGKVASVLGWLLFAGLMFGLLVLLITVLIFSSGP